ncbi:MAG TPA: hypothetical protein DCO80_02065 [Ornithinibacillus sp.]|nr:hypothetical protein [Ornithinibacillus sp.]
MQVVKRLKLSELADDVEVSIEESSTVYTVAELKHEILEIGEPHHESSNWYTITRKRWKPNAMHMVENYIEREYDEMYEDWDSRAMDCLTDEVVSKIQSILDKAFEGDYATLYWTCEDRVEIDIQPPPVVNA